MNSSLLLAIFFAGGSTLGLAEPARTSNAEPDEYLSSKSLSMLRNQISQSLTGAGIRVFSPRGWISMREMSVTGFCGGAALGEGMPRFNLSFREETTGRLIQDVQDENGDPLYFNQKPKINNKLGSFRGADGGESWSEMLISQDATWEPNGY